MSDLNLNSGDDIAIDKIATNDQNNNDQIASVISASIIDQMENMPSTMFYRSFAAKRNSPAKIRKESEDPEILNQIIPPSSRGGQFGTFNEFFIWSALPKF